MGIYFNPLLLKCKLFIHLWMILVAAFRPERCRWSSDDLLVKVVTAVDPDYYRYFSNWLSLSNCSYTKLLLFIHGRVSGFLCLASDGSQRTLPPPVAVLFLESPSFPVAMLSQPVVAQYRRSSCVPFPRILLPWCAILLPRDNIDPANTEWG